MLQGSSTCTFCGFSGAKAGGCCLDAQNHHSTSVPDALPSTTPSGSYSTRFRATRSGGPPQVPPHTTAPNRLPNAPKRRTAQSKAHAKSPSNSTAIFGIGPSTTAVPSANPSLVLSHTSHLTVSSTPIISPVIPTAPSGSPAQSVASSSVNSTIAASHTTADLEAGITFLPVAPHSTSASSSVAPPPSYESIIQSKEPTNARSDLWWNTRWLTEGQVQPYKEKGIIPEDSVRTKTRPKTPYFGCVLCEYVAFLLAIFFTFDC
jgi:hypothetical protein